jgi:hypothetical protein
MATMLDHQLGIVAESTYGTPPVVTRFHEWLAGSGIDWDPNVVDGEGLRVGAQVQRSTRRTPLVGHGTGKLSAELASKGFGVLLNACWGTGACTLVAGSTYQEVFTPVVAGTYLPSLAIQEGIVVPGGAVHPYTYAGCTISDFDLEMPENGYAKLTASVDAKSLATATALATASYPTNPTLFHSGLPLTGAMTIGGTLTAATTIALASIAAGTVAAVKSWKLSVKNTLGERPVLGARNQPVVGRRDLVLTTVVEYDATTGTVLRDAQIAQTPTPLLIAATTAEVLAPATATMQLAFAAAFVDKGAIPVPSAGEVVTTSIDWAIRRPEADTNNGAQMVLRTADTAL